MAASRKKRPLWAPWRIAYIRRLDAASGCFLCRKAADAAGDVTNHVIARGQWCYVLLNDYPYNPGHLLIAPYRHVADLELLTPDERGELLSLLVRGEQALKAVMAPHGFNAGYNQGRAAGAAVAEHLHWHLVPRWGGDTNFMPLLADTHCVPEALEETTALLRQQWPAE